MNYTRRELKQMETIEQAWDGSELKIEEDGVRVWLTNNENRSYDGDYQIETRINGSWHSKSYLDDGEEF